MRLAALFLTVMIFCPALAWSVEGPGAPLQVDFVDARGQIVQIRDEEPVGAPTTLAEFSEGVRKDPLRRDAALALAGALAGLLVFVLMPRWGFLETVKKFGLMLSLLAVIVTGGVLFKVETDPAFYDRVYPLWRPVRTHFQRPPKIQTGVMVWVKGESDRRYFIFENAGLRFPSIGQYTLNKISEISRASTSVAVASGETPVTWKEFERLKKKHEQRNEFVLVPHKRSLFQIDLKNEALLSDQAMRKVRDHAYQEKARLQRLHPEGTSASTSFQHYYTDAEENVIGSLKDAKGAEIKTGVWEDAWGLRQTYAVPYRLVEPGDPEISFWIWKDAGAKESWDDYAAGMPAEMKPYLDGIAQWLRKNMFTPRHFRKGEFPPDALQQMRFAFSDDTQFHFTGETWNNWLATLENP